MNYLDEIVTEMTNRDILAGLVTEAKRHPYKTINDIPHTMWDEVVQLLKIGDMERANEITKNLFSQIKDFKDYEAKHFCMGLLKKSKL